MGAGRARPRACTSTHHRKTHKHKPQNTTTNKNNLKPGVPQRDPPPEERQRRGRAELPDARDHAFLWDGPHHGPARLCRAGVGRGAPAQGGVFGGRRPVGRGEKDWWSGGDGFLWGGAEEGAGETRGVYICVCGHCVEQIRHTTHNDNRCRSARRSSVPFPHGYVCTRGCCALFAPLNSHHTSPIPLPNHTKRT